MGCPASVSQRILPRLGPFSTLEARHIQVGLQNCANHKDSGANAALVKPDAAGNAKDFQKTVVFGLPPLFLVQNWGG